MNPNPHLVLQLWALQVLRVPGQAPARPPAGRAAVLEAPATWERPPSSERPKAPRLCLLVVLALFL